MKTQLQRIRKEKGFKSARAFAEHIGMSKNTYTNYEQGTRPITLELAWEFADALECTLDELAGREWPRPSFADPDQKALNAYFESMNDEGRRRLLDIAEVAADADMVRVQKNAEPVRVPAEVERSA